MRTSKRRSLSVLLFALTACGGVGSIGNPDGGGGGTGPGDDGGIGDCPPGVNDGFSCNINGLTCPAAQPVTDCQGRPLATPECVCDGASWTCEHLVPTRCVSPPPPPTGSCPDPAMLVPGAPCDPTIMQQCVSTEVTIPDCEGGVIPSKSVCSCQGSWVCPVNLPACASPPPPACPDPVDVIPYASCAGQEMLVCPGNPKDCDGQTFFDALQCVGKWVTIASTACGDVVDAGPIGDAPLYVDAPPSVDAAHD
jgi:hypothetical protein